MPAREPLEVWIESKPTLETLAENLKCNLDAMTDLSEDEKEYLTRLNMIMVRQCLRDFGIE